MFSCGVPLQLPFFFAKLGQLGTQLSPLVRQTAGGRRGRAPGSHGSGASHGARRGW